MQKLWKLSALGFLLLIHSACQSTGEKYEEWLESYVGMTVRDLVDEWGRPSREYTGKNGTRIFYYISFPEGRNLSSYDLSSDLSGKPRQCRTKFVVDKTGTIVDWRWSGDACKAKEEEN